MDKFLQNFILIVIFFVVFLLLPKHVVVKPRIDKDYRENWFNQAEPLYLKKSRVKRQSCSNEVKCIIDYLFQCKIRPRDPSSVDDKCNRYDCSERKHEEWCNVTWTDYFTLRTKHGRRLLYPDFTLTQITLNTCLKICMELYGCHGVNYPREDGLGYENECYFTFDDYNDHSPDSNYDYYMLKKPEGIVACDSDEYRCSTNRCVYVGWLCDGEKDCINGRDEEGCSLMTGIYTKIPNQSISPVHKVAEGLSLQGCAKLCTEQEKRCSSFSYEEQSNKCNLGCTNCGYFSTATTSNYTDLYSLHLPQDAEYKMELLIYLSQIGKIFPITECSTSPYYGSFRKQTGILPLILSYRVSRSLPEKHILVKRRSFSANTLCDESITTDTEWELHKCNSSSLCLFTGERGRILKADGANTYGGGGYIHVVACAKSCLEEDGCRGFAHNYIGRTCYFYFDMDGQSTEVTNVVLYTLRGNRKSICKNGEYECSAGQCVSPDLVCDGRTDCNNGNDEQNCDAVEKYKEEKNYHVVSREQKNQERRTWKSVSVETCAKLCEDEAHHCKFFSYLRPAQLCVIGCPPESECGRSNVLFQIENSSLYYTSEYPLIDNNFQELVERSSNGACWVVRHYSTYRSNPYVTNNFTDETALFLQKKEGPCKEKVLECAPSLCTLDWNNCDGSQQCPTGKDEHKCYDGLCFFSLIIGRKLLIPKSKVWLGINLKSCAKFCLEMDGCLGFAYSNKGLTMCRFYFELSGEQVEDSNYDLYLLKNADRNLCPVNTFKCSHAQCIPQEAVCDDKEDCNNGKDEDSCGLKLPTTNVPRLPKLTATDPPVTTADCGQRKINFDPSQTQSFPSPRVIGSEERIVGGVQVPYGAYPWQAQIMVSNNVAPRHLCGGTILSAFHVLTAAHCMMDFPQSSFLIIVGQHNTRIKEEAEEQYAAQNIYIHNNYNRVTKENDIALVRIRPAGGRVIEFSKYVQPACLPQPDTPYVAETLCQVSGWGKEDADAPNVPESTSQFLRAAVVPLVSDSYCQSHEVYQGQGARITDNMFCAGYVRGGPDSCQGDSGGPLVCNIRERYTVMGIVSFGEKCGELLYPGVYVRVSHYLDWIQQHMNL